MHRGELEKQSVSIEDDGKRKRKRGNSNKQDKCQKKRRFDVENWHGYRQNRIDNCNAADDLHSGASAVQPSSHFVDSEMSHEFDSSGIGIFQAEYRRII
jgi:hypothetical protein